MDDLISRVAAIEALCRGEGCGNICRRAIERIPPAQRWTPEIEALAGMPADVIAIAYVYAKHMVNYGVDIAEKWETVTQQQAAFDAAYKHGRYDEWKRWAGKEDKITHWRELPEPPKEDSNEV